MTTWNTISGGQYAEVTAVATVENLLTYSEQFDNPIWVKDGATISSDSIISPDATTTADKLLEIATTANHRIYTGSTETGLQKTLSVYAKAGERQYLYMGFTTGSYDYAWFDLSAGTIGTVDVVYGTSAMIQSLGDGWYKCSITRTTTSTTWYSEIGAASADNIFSYAGDITKGIYIWGAQLEVGATPSTYVKTTTAARTALALTLTEDLMWNNEESNYYVKCLQDDNTLSDPMLATWAGTNAVAIDENVCSSQGYILFGWGDATIEQWTDWETV